MCGYSAGALLSVASIAMSIGAAWADTPPPSVASTVDESDCVNTPCRTARTIVIPPSADSMMQFSVGRSPYLTSESHIVIQPGENLVFRFSTDGDQPGQPKFIRAEALSQTPVPDLSDTNFDKMDKTDPNTCATAVEIANVKANGPAKERLKNQPPGTLILTYRSIPGAV